MGRQVLKGEIVDFHVRGSFPNEPRCPQKLITTCQASSFPIFTLTEYLHTQIPPNLQSNNGKQVINPLCTQIQLSPQICWTPNPNPFPPAQIQQSQSFLGSFFSLKEGKKELLWQMARSTEPLVVGGVIGDVIDLFVPSVDLAVYYGTKQVTNGCEIKPSLTVNRPSVQIAGRYYDDSVYTLVMTDPDAPSPSEPNLREWIQWLVTDIPGGTDPSQGTEMLAYMGPRPPIGIHRYVFALYKQQGPMVMVMPPQQRNNFSTRAFAAHYGLGLPVAAVYFNAQKEPGTRKR